MSIVARFKQYSPYTDPMLDLSRYLTPRRYRRHERKVASLPDFIDVHRSIAQDQYRYVERPRSNYARPRGGLLSWLGPSQAYLLSAANMEARIAFAKIAVGQLRRHPELHQQPLHFVTVSPMSYVRPFETAPQTNLHSLQRLTGQALSGLSFIGAPDFALLKAWGSAGIRSLHNHVGPHTNNIVFGASRDQIAQGMMSARLGFGGWTGGPAYHIKKITPEDLEGYLLYLLKAPLFYYHAKRGVRLFNNPHSHEAEHHSRFDAHPLRPGDQLRMAAVTHDMYLDELLFGQGDGTSLVRDIRDEAREPLHLTNEAARRQGKQEISATVNVRPDSRPLLSAYIREPLLQRLIRKWSKARAPRAKSTSSRPYQKSARLIHELRARDAELDDLDGEI